MTAAHFRRTSIPLLSCILAVLATLALGQAQSPEPPSKFAAKVWGHVRDSSGKPVANASVTLQPMSADQSPPATQSQLTHTDSNGTYTFAPLHTGVYAVQSRLDGYAEAVAGPVSLSENQTREIDFSLVSITSPTAAAAKPSPEKPAFFDEPQFTVAGVTQATNAGGHGSDTALRTTEALAKATLSLGKESGDSSSAQPSAETEASLRAAIARNQNDPAPHHRLGDLEEKLGNPLEAVREYQRATELDPSEPNVFDWGAELLTHRALEPAGEVFTKGNHLFPQSVRMLVSLGVTWYARGSYDLASQCLENASDLAPNDMTPYLFLGKMLSSETTPTQGSVDKLSRFVEMQPENAFANYYYALALLKQSANAGDVRGDQDATRSARVEALLKKTLNLDPKFGAAYLQLGILESHRANFAHAISMYRKAVEVSSEGDDTQVEAHYRLAQAYLRTGDKEEAKRELEVHSKLAKKQKEDSARGRREVQEFIISLRSNTTPSSQP